MREDRFINAARPGGRVDEGRWKLGFGMMVGLVLCVIALFAIIILGVTTGIGLVLAVPLAAAVVVAALVLFRAGAREVKTVCPVCNARFDEPKHLSEFDCPSCGSHLVAVNGVVRRAA
jgi:predicted RNA-binding Zn-ribbon protein involved in translation (DUF1610 family)